MVAPHPCYGCGKVGVVLCEHCKYDIVSEPFSGCIVCQSPHPYGICASHDVPFERVFVVGTREGTLKETIDGLKFSRTKAAAASLAELLDLSLPLLPTGVHVVPVPTVRSHIRQRGYDHALLVAKQFARRRSLSVSKALTRETNHTQHLADRAQREVQVKGAFSVSPEVARGLQGKTVLLVDDVVTTGSTLLEAAQVLRQAGVTVWAAALAYQQLE